MAERNVILPSQRAPFVGSDGRISPVWYRVLVDLYERTGGGSQDKVEVGATAAVTAQAAADAANAAAVNAQTAADAAQTAANTLEERFDFGLDIELR